MTQQELDAMNAYKTGGLESFSKTLASPVDTSKINSSVFVKQPDIEYKTPEITPPTSPAGIQTDPVEDPFAMTETETKASDLSTRIMTLNDTLSGKSAYKSSLESSNADLLSQKQTEADLTSQLKTLQADAKNITAQVQVNNEGRGTSRAAVNSQTDAEMRRNSIKANTVGALLAATQGKITYAQSLIDKAVEDKYGPLEAEQKAKIANLEIILKSPEYSLQDKKRASAQKAIEDAKTQEIADKKKNEADIQAIVLEAAKNGADSSALALIGKATTAIEAAQYGARYLGAEYTDTRNKYLDTQKQQAFENSLKTGQFNLDKQQIERDVKQQAFENGVTLQQLQLDRAKFASDQEYNNAKLVLDGMKIDEKTDLSVTEKLKLKEGGFTIDAQGNIVKASTSPAEEQNARDVIATIDGLLGPNSELNSAVGGLDQFKPDSMIGNFKAEFDQLQAKLAFANLDKLKGPMSDKDIQFLKDSSSGLNRSMSQDQFRTKLEKIKERFNVTLLKPGELQVNSLAGDGTYSYRNLDGTVHTGKQGDGYVDNTPPPAFSNVGGDTNKALSYNEGEKAGQCGVFVNKVSGIRVGNSKQAKFDNVSNYGKKGASGIKIGDVIVQNIGTYGHVAVVTEVLKDGSVKVSESNYNNDEKVGQGRVVSPSKIYGYISPYQATSLAINKPNQA